MWGNEAAHVIWLYFYNDLEDRENANWFCSTQWIAEDLEDKPSKLKGNDIVDDIIIFWNDLYFVRKQFYNENSCNKEEYLERMLDCLTELEKIANILINTFKEYNEGIKTERAFINILNEYNEKFDKVYDKSANKNFVPIECSDFNDIALEIISYILIMCTKVTEAVTKGKYALDSWIAWKRQGRNPKPAYYEICPTR